MRTVVQRVMKASVSVGDELVSSIGRGICVLVGISRDDTKKDIDYMVRKILSLRVFENDEGKRWMHSVKEKQYEILCVSQFTLYCTLKGNKPDYHLSMGAEQSQQFYNDFLDELRKAYKPELIKDGQFGAYMQVSIQNDGPVTINLDSPVTDQAPSGKQKGGGQRSAKSPPQKEAAAGTSSSEAAAIPSSAAVDAATQMEEKLIL